MSSIAPCGHDSSKLSCELKLINPWAPFVHFCIFLILQKRILVTFRENVLKLFARGFAYQSFFLNWREGVKINHAFFFKILPSFLVFSEISRDTGEVPTMLVA